MRLKTLFLSCSLIALSISAIGGDRPYEYMLDQPKWDQERAEARIELRTAWACLTGRQSAYVLPDTILSDSVIPHSRLVNDGELHHIQCVREGMRMEDYYYKDANGNMVEVLGSVSSNNGQPYSLSPYHYITSDGLVTFNTRKWIEMVLWGLNVLVSPWMWLVIVLSLFVVIFRRYKRD